MFLATFSNIVYVYGRSRPPLVLAALATVFTESLNEVVLAGNDAISV